jgi:transcriptional regulator with XRE-family HTH domain
MSIHMSFAEKLKNDLDHSGLSQAALARRAGLSPSAVSRMLSGRAIPSPANCRRLALALGVHPTALLVAAGHVDANDIDLPRFALELERLLELADLSPEEWTEVSHFASFIRWKRSRIEGRQDDGAQSAPASHDGT